MNQRSHMPKLHFACAIAVAAMTCLHVRPAQATAAFANATFHGEGSSTRLVCDMRAISPKFANPESLYTASGTCVSVEGVTETTSSVRTSEFPTDLRTIESTRLGWTSKGSYNASTHEASEWISLSSPGPRLDKYAQAPHGTVSATMVCNADPWIQNGTGCTGIRVTITGNIGAAEPVLRSIASPFTSHVKISLQQAFNDAYQAYRSGRGVQATEHASKTVPSSSNSMAPQVVEPQPGSVHRPKTPLAIRVIPAKRGFVTDSYLLEIETRQVDQNWQSKAKIYVSAATVTAANGNAEWGAGNAPDRIAQVGLYRLRVSASGQDGPASDWREFSIAGMPALPSGAGQKSRFSAGAHQTNVAPAATPMAQTGGSSLATPQGALLKQAAEPAGAAPWLQRPTVATPVPQKANVQSLNPQPLPPVVPLTLPAQAPSSLR